MPKGINKKLDKAKGLWVEPLHEVLWSYHATPNSTTGETIFYTSIWGGRHATIQIRHVAMATLSL